MTGYTTRRWAIVDDEGEPIRFFDYPAEGAVEIKEPELTFDELLDEVGDCLL